MAKKRLVMFGAVVVALTLAGWKWGGSAQGNAGIECSPYCNVKPPVGLPLPEPGPCFYHGGVAWVIPGFTEEGEYVLYYGCRDGNVITVHG